MKQASDDRCHVISALGAAALLAALGLLLAGHFRAPGAAAQAPENGGSGRGDWWMDMSIGPPLIELFNQAAREDDIARVDHYSQAAQLNRISKGRKLVIFRSIAETEELLPRLAGQIDIIGYNLEHGPATPQAEKDDPVASMRAMRDLADAYGLALAVGPDHDFAQSHGTALAPFADIFVLQVQRQQTNPGVVARFVEPIVPALRAANPDLAISVQVRTEGDPAEIIELVESLEVPLDGISILTSPETVDTAEEMVAVLRPELSLSTGLDESARLLLLLAALALLAAALLSWRRRQASPPQDAA